MSTASIGRLLLAGILLVAAPRLARAWGEDGHSIVAEIAGRRLTPAARTAVDALLGPGASLASVASWADDVRGRRPDTARWHYVDIPLARLTYDPAQDCRPEAAGDCVVAAIGRERAILADRDAAPAARAEALMWLVHLVGDVHQPLHTVADGRGENDIHVRFPADPIGLVRSHTNLHAVWDSGLIRHAYWSWGAYVRTLESGWLHDHAAETAALAGGTPADWAVEAHGVAQDAVAGVEPGDDLGETYIKEMRPLVDRQLSLAGLRLARLLNEDLATGKVGQSVWPPFAGSTIIKVPPAHASN